MTKRRLNNKQTLRIGKNQESHQINEDAQVLGLVIQSFGKEAEIEDSRGVRIRCSIRANLESLVAGDRVVWQSEGRDHGVVLSVQKRTNLLARPSATGVKKPVAANITQLIIVVAPKPVLSWPLLDSYLIMAETLGLRAVIVMNKGDLLADDLKNEFKTVYEPLGYPLLWTNKIDMQGYESLKAVLKAQVSVFVGQSGVGKSSLIGGILPPENLVLTQAISSISKLGRHTTSNSRYYHLPEGGAIIDSPGVREFSLWRIDEAMIVQGYKEFVPLAACCKYRNCKHQYTPDCAIIKALENGTISKRRYDSFTELCMQHNR